jgi:hypothetical protein
MYVCMYVCVCARARVSAYVCVCDTCMSSVQNFQTASALIYSHPVYIKVTSGVLLRICDIERDEASREDTCQQHLPFVFLIIYLF